MLSLGRGAGWAERFLSTAREGQEKVYLCFQDGRVDLAGFFNLSSIDILG